MKRILISIVAIVGVSGLIALLRFHPASQAQSTDVASQGPNPTATPDTSTPTVTTPVPTIAAGGYKNGTYTGSTVDVGYGPVQVQAVISGGKITSVNFLQMPTDERESAQRSARAEPVLRQEALTAQTANVDAVSGATQTSEGFNQSLGSALAKAKA